MDSRILHTVPIASPRTQSTEDLDRAAARPGTTLEGTTPGQWRVVWTTEPQTRAMIGWSTREQGKRHEVRFDTEPRDGNLDAYRKVVRCKQNGRYESFSDGPDLYYHSVQLERLKPATKYYVVMTSDGESSREFHFVTAPDDDRDIALL